MQDNRMILISASDLENLLNAKFEEFATKQQRNLENALDVKLELRHLNATQAAKYISRSNQFLYRNSWIPSQNSIYKIAHLNLLKKAQGAIYTAKEVKQRFLNLLKDADLKAYEKVIEIENKKAGVN